MTTILHLTDLHFGAESTASPSALAQRVNTLESLRETLFGLRESDRPDVVVVSGDIGWAGRPADYTAAAEWLRSVLGVLNLAPERLVLCAGNHDLDRTEAEVLDRPGVAARADQLLRVEKLGQISRPFAAFESFAREMGVPPLRIGSSDSWLVGERNLCGIRFVIANTAWFCRDDEDRGKLFVGLPQLEVMEAAGQLLRPAEYDRGDFTVAVLHHPETWLADDETTAYEGRPATYYYLADRCHVLLSGHTHGGLEGPRRSAEGGMLFVGGASYVGGRYRNNVSLLRIDPAARSVERTPFEFDPRDRRWHVREATTHVIRRSPAPPPTDATVSRAAEPRDRIPVHKPPRNLPPRQSTFAGREAELRELHERLSGSREVGITQQAAVHGHGGIGKTSLAIEYGWKHLDDYPGGVFFLSCESELPPPVAELAPHLGLENAPTSDKTALRVKAHLETGAPCLLILDNVRGAQQWRSRDWSRHLPGEACQRLITTRADTLPGVAMYPLQRLTREDGVRLLAEYRTDVMENEGYGAEVVEWFDGLAVGLTVVGAYMARQRRMSWREYVDHLNRKGLTAVRQTERAVGALPDYEARVDAVFDELMDALPLEQRRALEYAALLPEDQVYAPWLTELMADDEEVKAPDLPGPEEGPWQPIVWALTDAELMRIRGDDEHVLGLHRVLRRRVRERLADAGSMAQLISQITKLAARRGNASHDALTNVAQRRELAPLVALSRELEVLGSTEAAASLASWISRPLSDLGRFTEARALLEEFASVNQLNALPVEQAATLLSNFAMILKQLGEFTAAREQMERAIVLYTQYFDPDHPALATSYANLALILRSLGELAEARRQMERAIEITERNFAPDHAKLAISYSNLALILQDLGELEEARQRMERAIEIGERNLDPEHPMLATHYSNLATILYWLGERSEARRRMERAIEIDERHFDPDHPMLAIRYSNLATILRDLGELADAREQIEQTIKIEERLFHPDHPTLAISYSNLAMILKDLGELVEARRWIYRAIEIEEQHFDPNHPTLASSYNNLAYIELESGNRERACELLQRAKAILDKHFTPTHPHMRIVMEGIAQACTEPNDEEIAPL